MKHMTFDFFVCDRCGRKYLIEQDRLTVSAKTIGKVFDLCAPCSAQLEEWFGKYKDAYKDWKELTGFEPEEYEFND